MCNLCTPQQSRSHSNNGALIWYTQLLVQYKHTVTVLPVFRLPKSAPNHKLTLQTFFLQTVSHFDLRKQTLTQFGNQSVQSKMADD